MTEQELRNEGFVPGRQEILHMVFNILKERGDTAMEDYVRLEPTGVFVQYLNKKLDVYWVTEEINEYIATLWSKFDNDATKTAEVTAMRLRGVPDDYIQGWLDSLEEI